MKNTPTFEQVVAFHGHACPGLALGYRVAREALEQLHIERAQDEELVAIVENNACGVDAIQMMTGCTFGKGNLFFKDYGKHVYTFYNRQTGKGIRIYAENYYTQDQFDQRFVQLSKKIVRSDAEENELRRIVDARIELLLEKPAQDFLKVAEALEPIPERAKIFSSSRCDRCHEKVMSGRLQNIDGQNLCLDCLETDG